MLRKGVKTLVLYLEDWQKRMIKDFLGLDCDVYEFKFPQPEPPEPIYRYGIPVRKESKRMYFTEWQMREMRDEVGKVCEFIELHKDEQHVLYMGPMRK